MKGKMSPETPSSSGSDTSLRPPLKGNEERLMVAIRVRPLKNDDSHRVLYAADRKVSVIFCTLQLFNKSK